MTQTVVTSETCTAKYHSAATSARYFRRPLLLQQKPINKKTNQRINRRNGKKSISQKSRSGFRFLNFPPWSTSTWLHQKTTKGPPRKTCVTCASRNQSAKWMRSWSDTYSTSEMDTAETAQTQPCSQETATNPLPPHRRTAHMTHFPISRRSIFPPPSRTAFCFKRPGHPTLR